MKKYYVFLIIVGLIAAGAIVWQSLASGPVKADQALTTRIEAVQTSVNDFNSQHGRLPIGLSEIKGDHTGVSYETVDKRAYKLCGTFQTSSRNQHASGPGAPDGSTYINASEHDKGTQCFTGTVSGGLNIGK